MPDAATSAYLARHYLDGAKAEAMLARAGQSSSVGGAGGSNEGKKRKKKRPAQAEGASTSLGLRMVDDADDSWKVKLDDEEDGEQERVVVADQTDPATPAKRKQWNRLGAGARDESPKDDAQTSEAARTDRTASAAGPSFRAGLKTREEMRAERVAREERIAKEADHGARAESQRRAEEKERQRHEAQQETIYRDASGRQIDLRAEEEDQRRAQREKERKERERQDWNKGEAQLRQARDARQRETQVRSEGVTRYATDARMNEELRHRERAVADPAAAFLSSSKEARRGPHMPLYKGSFPPNRFGIRPGYRWDGVERGNGFESKLFQRRNERSVRQAEERAWRQEDM